MEKTKSVESIKSIKSLLRSWDGPLTDMLVQQPGRFGLGKVPKRLAPDQTTNMVCGFCSTGCSLKVHLQEGEAVNLSANTDYPVNLGMACPKGWEALTPLEAEDRATVPYLRNKEGVLEAVDWSMGIRTFVDRFKSIRNKYGKESVAFLSTGQIVSEEMAFLGALTKFGMGIRHGDGNTRQCMATSVAAYKQSFGFDAPPYTYQDFEESDVLVFVGANPCIAHPIMWQRVLRNRNHPEIIVVDPRKTETAMNATQHYPLQPKSDLVLLYGIAHILIEEKWIDKKYIENHTSEFEGFAEFVKKFTPEMVSQKTGLSVKSLRKFSETIHRGKRVSFWWTMGVNQSYEGTRVAQAIINLALITGNIGRSGTGANSITGQCNAMGSRLFSNTTNLLGGHDFQKVEHRQKVAETLGIPLECIPDENSWAYDQIVQGIKENKIKGLWIIATNTSHSWINQSKWKKLAEQLEFLVVQDMYHTTETAQQADLVLPAAGWGEKEGTFINSERRIGVVKKIKKAPGQALSDFNIFRLIAHHWGCEDFFQKWDCPESVFQILKKLSKGQPCDISGIKDYKMIEEEGGIQWPLAEGDILEKSERRLFEDGVFYHSDGKAKILFEEPKEMVEPLDEDYCFLLLTGRGTSSQWHTQTRTGKSEVLKKLYPQEVYVEINPRDAEEFLIEPEDKVKINSRRGEITARAFLTPTVQPGQIFVPMHYRVTNQLTHDAFDPYSRQPSYKACAVKIEKWSGF